jgi:hypothetical protein
MRSIHKNRGELMKEILIQDIRAVTIAQLLEDYANLEGEGLLPSYKQEAWNIAQDLRDKVKQ